MRYNSRESLIYEVANMYYNKGMTQAEIAKAMYISRSSISRILQAGKDSGMVEIRIHYHSDRCSYLEELICKQFSIKEAFIYDYGVAEKSQVFNSICSKAAEYVSAHMNECSVFGISRGSVVDRILDNIKSPGADHHDLKLVQMHGCENSSMSTRSSENLMRRMLTLYGGTAYYLNAPMYVQSAALRQQLEKEPSIRQALDLAASADMTVTGIGALTGNWYETSFLVNYLDEQTISELISQKCVGHIFGQFFDEYGRQVDHSVNRRGIGIPFERISQIPRAISVVYGADRATAALGALRGHLTNVIFMDKACAEMMLALHQR